MTVQVYHGLEAVDPPMRGVTLTFGNFDGVHLGHQQILAQAGMLAERDGSSVVAVTFDPHPLKLIAPQRPLRFLTTLDERIRLLAQAGADAVVVVDTTQGFLEQSPEQFVADVVAARFAPAHVVEGPSWRFGRGREGDVAMLQRLGDKYGFEVYVVPGWRLEIDASGPVLVTSTLIRDLLGKRHVHRASLCLGRPYCLVGEVVRGNQRGRKLGFPTANLDVGDLLIPGEGIYAGWCSVGEEQHVAAISIGRNPTFGEGHLTVEAHLLDFDEDIYDRTVKVSLLRHIRDQQRFDSPDALVRQMGKDIQQVREVCRAAE
ncbi:MAG: bifunctional riboflavin kinase/FAD synthetase [Phycisphaerae bacterium]|nr:bifunctional riboflavin kinase/FAD synthetase [Phycisphaerae bacterium]